MLTIKNNLHISNIFKDLKIGDVFCIEGKISKNVQFFLKIDKINDRGLERNVICLNDFSLYNIVEYQSVEKVDATLEIKKY